MLMTYRMHRKLNRDVLERATPEAMAVRLHPRMMSFGGQFRHLGDVQKNYIRALKTGEIRFDSNPETFGLETDIEGLKAYLDDLDKELEETLKSPGPEKIRWPHGDMSREETLSCLVEHEVLHQGIFLVFLHQLDLPFPASWSIWGYHPETSPV